MRKLVTKTAVVLSSLAIILTFWYLVFSPRYFFLESVMDCMLEVGSSSKEAYEFCCEVVRESK